MRKSLCFPKNRQQIAVLLLLSILTLSNVFLFPIPANAVVKSNHLQYFGYYHADGCPFGSSQYIDDIYNLNNSNVVVFNFSGYADPRYETVFHNYLNLASSRNLQVFVNIYDCFFGWNPGGMGDGSGALRSN